jgi:hypothetical protein
VTGVKINRVAQRTHEQLPGNAEGLQIFTGCFCKVNEERVDVVVLLVESAEGVVGRGTSTSTYHRKEKIFFRVMAPLHICFERLRDLPDLAAVQRSARIEILDDAGERWDRALDQPMFLTEYLCGSFDVFRGRSPRFRSLLVQMRV